VPGETEHIYQHRYWNQLIQLRVDSYYIHAYHEAMESRQTALNMFLAVAASASIASWAIWKQFAFLWATVIASSQLLSAVKHYLPFERRVKQLAPLSIDLDQLFLDAERQWYAVAEGQLPNQAIHEALISLKERRTKADHTYFKETALPSKPKLLKEAEQRATAYLSQSYS